MASCSNADLCGAGAIRSTSYRRCPLSEISAVSPFLCFAAARPVAAALLGWAAGSLLGAVPPGAAAVSPLAEVALLEAVPPVVETVASPEAPSAVR